MLQHTDTDTVWRSTSLYLGAAALVLQHTDTDTDTGTCRHRLLAPWCCTHFLALLSFFLSSLSRLFVSLCVYVSFSPSPPPPSLSSSLLPPPSSLLPSPFSLLPPPRRRSSQQHGAASMPSRQPCVGHLSHGAVKFLSNLLKGHPVSRFLDAARLEKACHLFGCVVWHGGRPV